MGLRQRSARGRSPRASAIGVLGAAGARVDGARVRLTPGLVDRALASAPRRITLKGRGGSDGLELTDGQSFFGTGSDCLYVRDPDSDERRRATSADVEEMAALCERLEHIDFVMSMVLPADVSQMRADIYQMHVMLNKTVKPIVYVSYEANGLVAAVQMAEAVVGGEEALRQKPILTCYINVISGAVHNDVGGLWAQAPWQGRVIDLY